MTRALFFLILFYMVLFSQTFEIYLKNYQSNEKYQQILHVNIEGLVSVDNKPVAALIEIHSTFKNHGVIDRVYSNANSGVFKTSLKTGDEYELVVKANKLPQQILIINAKHLDSSKTINVYADFTSAAYDHKLEALKKSIDEKMKNDIRMSSFEKQYGKVKKENLVYKIQVGAFKFYENFNYTSVIDLPKIIRKTDSDYITRFTIGNYHTYSEASNMLKKVQDCDLKEAFIIAYYNGERKLLSQLITEKILN